MMNFKKYPIDPVIATELLDDSITTEKFCDKTISTGHISNVKIPYTKVSNNAVTTEKLADETLKPYQFSPSIRNGFREVDPLRWLPLLRYRAMITSGRTYPTTISSSYSGATLLASLLGLASLGVVSRNFRGIDFAKLSPNGHGDVWSDPIQQYATYGSSTYFDIRLSVFCVKNTSAVSQTMDMGIYTSSSSNYAGSYGEVVYKIVDLDENDKPVKSSLQTNDIQTLYQITTSTNSNSVQSGSITVPAGKGLIFMLKTAATYYTSTTYSFYVYHHSHGFKNMINPSYGKIKCRHYMSNPFEVCLPMYEAILNLDN